MALRSDRQYGHGDISFFMNAVAERGGVVSFSSATSSGTAMDQSEATVAYVAEPSGIQPLGILISEMVNEDLTRQHRNWHKEEVQLGGKVNIWTQGTVVTDYILTGHTPAAGGLAYVAHSGFLATTDEATDAVAANNRIVGRWLSGADENGFAKLQINLPLT